MQASIPVRSGTAIEFVRGGKGGMICVCDFAAGRVELSLLRVDIGPHYHIDEMRFPGADVI